MSEEIKPNQAGFKAIAEQQSTLRDQFAMAALAGIISNSSLMVASTEVGTIAQDAYKLADAMLEAREKK